MRKLELIVFVLFVVVCTAIHQGGVKPLMDEKGEGRPSLILISRKVLTSLYMLLYPWDGNPVATINLNIRH